MKKKGWKNIYGGDGKIIQQESQIRVICIITTEMTSKRGRSNKRKGDREATVTSIRFSKY